MAKGNIYKPRYYIAYKTKSKLWPYKNSYLRRFYAFRARRAQRGGLLRRCVRVATTLKWTEGRRHFRPLRRTSGAKSPSTGKVAYGRPKKRRFRDRFYKKQQLRTFHGKRKEEAFRHFFRNHLCKSTSRSFSFFSALESRLARVFFRRRFLPTVFACHQFIHHYGLELNHKKIHAPATAVSVGDRISVSPSVWKSFYWDLFCRVYYRRWGRYVHRRRRRYKFKKKLFLLRTRLAFRRRKISKLLRKGLLVGKKRSAFKATFGRVIRNKRYNSRLKGVRQLGVYSKRSAYRKTGLSSVARFRGVRGGKAKRFRFAFHPRSNINSKRSSISTLAPQEWKDLLEMVSEAKIDTISESENTEDNHLGFFSRNRRFRPFITSQSNTSTTANVIPNGNQSMNKARSVSKGKTGKAIGKVVGKSVFSAVQSTFTVGQSKLRKAQKVKAYNERLYTFRSRLLGHIKENKNKVFIASSSETDFDLTYAKLRQLQKFHLSLRLRKSLGLRVTQYHKGVKRSRRVALRKANKTSRASSKEKENKAKESKGRKSIKAKGSLSKVNGNKGVTGRKGRKVKVSRGNWRFSNYRRHYLRRVLLRIYAKARKKRNRRRKFVRRKGVHFFIPSYLHRDFRTLRAVKVQSPRLEDIHYSFRISLPKVYAFYRSKGF